MKHVRCTVRVDPHEAFARLTPEMLVQKMAAADMKTVLDNFKCENIPSKITALGVKAGVPIADFMEKQSHMLMNMHDAVSKFREKRQGAARLMKPRPGILFEAMAEGDGSRPLALQQLYEDVLGNKYDYQECILNATFSDRALATEKMRLLLLTACGFLTIMDGGYEHVVFKEDEVALLQAAQRLQKLDAEVDLRALVSMAPKDTLHHTEQSVNNNDMDAMLELAGKFLAEGSVEPGCVRLLGDPFRANTLASQMADDSAKRKLDEAAEEPTQALAGAAGNQSKKIKTGSTKVEVTEDSVNKHKVVLSKALKFYLSTKTAFVNMGAAKAKFAQEEDDKDAAALFTFRFMEEAGLGKIGGHNASLTFTKVAEEDKEKVCQVLAALSTLKEKVVAERLASRADVHSSYSWDRFKKVMGAAGVDVEAALQAAAADAAGAAAPAAPAEAQADAAPAAEEADARNQAV